MLSICSSKAGLPWVPAAVPGELLGAWLLRLAEAYGVGLNSFIVRLGAAAPRTEGSSLPHWFAIDTGSLNWAALSDALRLPAEDLAAMTAPKCRPYWPQEVGFCPACLAQDGATGQPPTWYLRWMHPLVTACERHNEWLVPMPTRTLRSNCSARRLAQLLVSASSADLEPNQDAPALIDGAAWLQQLFVTTSTESSIWSDMPRWQLMRVVDSLASLLMSDGAADWARDRLGETAESPPVEAWSQLSKHYVVEDKPGTALHFILPAGLRQRQLLLGLIGRWLREPAGVRPLEMELPSGLIRKLLYSSIGKWPLAAVEQISPPAAEVLGREAELRERLDVSPAYFEACEALRDELL